jgi:surface protein
MVDIEFIFNEIKTIYKCDSKEEIGEIYKKYANDIGKDFNSLNFIHINENQNNRNKIFIIVSKKNNYIEGSNDIIIRYKIDKRTNSNECTDNNITTTCIKIFGKNFVENNRNICKIIFEDKKYDLSEQFEASNDKEFLEIKLRVINELTNINSMFEDCNSLISITNISKLNISNVNELSHIFYGCSSLETLSDISNWNTQNVISMKGMFSGCSSLTSLTDISNWKTSKVL